MRTVWITMGEGGFGERTLLHATVSRRNKTTPPWKAENKKKINSGLGVVYRGAWEECFVVGLVINYKFSFRHYRGF